MESGRRLLTEAVWKRHSTALGEFLLAATEKGLCSLGWAAPGDLARLEAWGERHGVLIVGEDTGARLDRACAQLTAFCKGELRAFDLSLDMRGTKFQLAVWHELCAIPFGTTLTYGELARRVENPGGSRAVGSANGKNPIPVVVPCHRVVAADGLGGFSGGLERKEALLALEGARLF